LLTWAPSLTRGRVCRLQSLLDLASAVILGAESLGTHHHNLLYQIPNPPVTLRAKSTYSPPPPQEQEYPVIPLGTGFPSSRLLRLAGLRWRCPNLPPRLLNDYCPLCGPGTDRTVNTFHYCVLGKQRPQQLVGRLGCIRTAWGWVCVSQPQYADGWSRRMDSSCFG
jgi:hypothetical protein